MNDYPSVGRHPHLRRTLRRFAGPAERVLPGSLLATVRRSLDAVLGGDSTVVIDGLKITGPPEDRAYLGKVRRGSEERLSVHIFGRHVKPGMTVLDIGAHLGLFALSAAGVVGPEGRVYAFEPSPRIYTYLVRNIAANSLEDVIVPVQKAVTDRAGSLAMVESTDPRMSYVAPARVPSNLTSIEGVSIDDYLGDRVRVDAVKIDVEGHEPRVLRGMEATLRRSGDDLFMIVEYNPLTLSRAGESGPHLIEALRELGFSLWVIDEGGQRLHPLDTYPLRNVKYTNLLCTRRTVIPESFTGVRSG